MKRFRSLIAGVLVAGLLTSGAAFAQGRGPGGPAGRGRAFGAPHLPVAALNLTDAQQQQIREIRERYRTAAEQIAARVRAAMDAQRNAVEAVPLNEGQIRSTTLALAEAQTEAAIHEATVFNEVWALLTPDQQAQAAKAKAERASRQQQRPARQRQQ
jgi:Spy/CpxP family protein refolding chaperone